MTPIDFDIIEHMKSPAFRIDWVNAILKDMTPAGQLILIKQGLMQATGDPMEWEKDLLTNRLMWAHFDNRVLTGYQETPVQGYFARNNQPPHDVCMARTNRLIYDLDYAMGAVLKLLPGASIKTHYCLKTEGPFVRGRHWHVSINTLYDNDAYKKVQVEEEGDTLALATWRAYFAFLTTDERNS